MEQSISEPEDGEILEDGEVGDYVESTTRHVYYKEDERKVTRKHHRDMEHTRLTRSSRASRKRSRKNSKPPSATLFKGSRGSNSHSSTSNRRFHGSQTLNHHGNHALNRFNKSDRNVDLRSELSRRRLSAASNGSLSNSGSRSRSSRDIRQVSKDASVSSISSLESGSLKNTKDTRCSKTPHRAENKRHHAATSSQTSSSSSKQRISHSHRGKENVSGASENNWITQVEKDQKVTLLQQDPLKCSSALPTNEPSTSSSINVNNSSSVECASATTASAMEAVSDDNESIVWLPLNRKSPEIITLDCTDTSDDDEGPIKNFLVHVENQHDKETSGDLKRTVTSSDSCVAQVSESLGDYLKVNISSEAVTSSQASQNTNQHAKTVKPPKSTGAKYGSDSEEEIEVLEMRNELLAGMVERMNTSDVSDNGSPNNSLSLTGSPSNSHQQNEDANHAINVNASALLPNVSNKHSDSEDENDLLRAVLLSQIAIKAQRKENDDGKSDQLIPLTPASPSPPLTSCEYVSLVSTPIILFDNEQSSCKSTLSRIHHPKALKRSETIISTTSGFASSSDSLTISLKRRAKFSHDALCTASPSFRSPNSSFSCRAGQNTNDCQTDVRRIVRLTDEPVRSSLSPKTDIRNLPENDLRMKLMRNRRRSNGSQSQLSPGMSPIFEFREFGVVDTDLRVGNIATSVEEQTITRTVNFNPESSGFTITQSNVTGPISIDIPPTGSCYNLPVNQHDRFQSVLSSDRFNSTASVPALLPSPGLVQPSHSMMAHANSPIMQIHQPFDNEQMNMNSNYLATYPSNTQQPSVYADSVCNIVRSASQSSLHSQVPIMSIPGYPMQTVQGSMDVDQRIQPMNMLCANITMPIQNPDSRHVQMSSLQVSDNPGMNNLYGNGGIGPTPFSLNMSPYANQHTQHQIGNHSEIVQTHVPASPAPLPTVPSTGAAVSPNMLSMQCIPSPNMPIIGLESNGNFQVMEHQQMYPSPQPNFNISSSTSNYGSALSQDMGSFDTVTPRPEGEIHSNSLVESFLNGSNSYPHHHNDSSGWESHLTHNSSLPFVGSSPNSTAINLEDEYGRSMTLERDLSFSSMDSGESMSYRMSSGASSPFMEINSPEMDSPISPTVSVEKQQIVSPSACTYMQPESWIESMSTPSSTEKTSYEQQKHLNAKDSNRKVGKGKIGKGKRKAARKRNKQAMKRPKTCSTPLSGIIPVHEESTLSPIARSCTSISNLACDTSHDILSDSNRSSSDRESENAVNTSKSSETEFEKTSPPLSPSVTSKRTLAQRSDYSPLLLEVQKRNTMLKTTQPASSSSMDVMLIKKLKSSTGNQSGSSNKRTPSPNHWSPGLKKVERLVIPLTDNDTSTSEDECDMETSNSSTSFQASLNELLRNARKASETKDKSKNTSTDTATGTEMPKNQSSLGISEMVEGGYLNKPISVDESETLKSDTSMPYQGDESTSFSPMKIAIKKDLTTGDGCENSDKTRSGEQLDDGDNMSDRQTSVTEKVEVLTAKGKPSDGQKMKDINASKCQISGEKTFTEENAAEIALLGETAKINKTSGGTKTTTVTLGESTGERKITSRIICKNVLSDQSTRKLNTAQFSTSTLKAQKTSKAILPDGARPAVRQKVTEKLHTNKLTPQEARKSNSKSDVVVQAEQQDSREKLPKDAAARQAKMLIMKHVQNISPLTLPRSTTSSRNLESLKPVQSKVSLLSPNTGNAVLPQLNQLVTKAPVKAPSKANSLNPFPTSSKAIIDQLMKQISDSRDHLALTHAERSLITARQKCLEEMRGIKTTLMKHVQFVTLEADCQKDIVQMEQKLQLLKARKEILRSKAKELNSNITVATKLVLPDRVRCIKLARQVKDMGQKVVGELYRVPDIYLKEITDATKELGALDSREPPHCQLERGVAFNRLFGKKTTHSAVDQARKLKSVTVSASNPICFAGESRSQTTATSPTNVLKEKKVVSARQSKICVEKSSQEEATGVLQKTPSNQDAEICAKKTNDSNSSQKESTAEIPKQEEIVVKVDFVTNSAPPGLGNMDGVASRRNILYLTEYPSITDLNFVSEPAWDYLNASSIDSNIDPNVVICPDSLLNGKCTNEGCQFQHV